MDTTLKKKELGRCKCSRGYWKNDFGLCIRCMRKQINYNQISMLKEYNLVSYKDTRQMVKRWQDNMYQYLLAVDK